MKRYRLLAATLLLGVTAAAAPVVALPGAQPTQQAEAACSKAPAWTGTKTRFGVSLSTSDGQTLKQDLDAEEKRFGRIPVVRTWDPSVPPSNAWEKRKPWFGSRWVVTSFRLKPAEVLSGRYDSQLLHYFRTAPTDVPIFWNYFHEPEDEVKRGEFTAAQYRSAFRHIVDLAAPLCRTNLYPTLVLMGWTSKPESKLNWKDWYPGPAYISVLAWDPYNSATGKPTSYVDPATLYDSVVTVSRAAGKPWGIAETGSARVAGDGDYSGRAAWLTKVGRYFRDKGAVFVTYFQSTRNGDFELRDSRSIAAWKSWVQS